MSGVESTAKSAKKRREFSFKTDSMYPSLPYVRAGYHEDPLSSWKDSAWLYRSLTDVATTRVRRKVTELLAGLSGSLSWFFSCNHVYFKFIRALRE